MLWYYSWVSLFWKKQIMIDILKAIIGNMNFNIKKVVL